MPPSSPQDFKPAIYAQPGDLPAEFRRFVSRSERLTVFRHPFLVDFFPLALPLPVGELIEARELRAEGALAGGDLGSYVFMHERVFRMDALLQMLATGLFEDQPDKYWDLARKVWIDGELSEDDPRWRQLLEAPCGPASRIMSDKDRAAFDTLPEMLTLHRGVQAADQASADLATRGGFSWTLSEDIALKFARRFIRPEDTPFIATAIVPKSLAIAQLTGRGEDEVLIDPNHTADLEITLQALGKDSQESRELVTLRAFAIQG